MSAFGERHQVSTAAHIDKSNDLVMAAVMKNCLNQSSTEVRPNGSIDEEYHTIDVASTINSEQARLEITTAVRGVATQLPTRKQARKIKLLSGLMTKDVGPTLRIISSDALAPAPWEVTWSQEPELLCSYNWQDIDAGENHSENYIFVPGAPPKWTPLTLPRTLPPDKGYEYMDHNHHRQPFQPYGPMFLALGEMNPMYQFSTVDVIADRNNLRNLLDFVKGRGTKFRLDLYVVGNTLILVRKETKFWTQVGHAGGYGHRFEEFFTRPVPGLEEATSHYRAIRYPLGPLNIVVRYEADAYYEEPTENDKSSSEERTPKGDQHVKPRFNLRGQPHVIRRGNVIDCHQIAELKSANIKYDAEGRRNGGGRSSQHYDQLWFGRTRHLITGFHDPVEGASGEIISVKHKDMKENLDNWERGNQESLRKLVTLLTQLRDFVKAQPGPIRAAVLVRDETGGPIQIRVMEDKHHILGHQFFTKHWNYKGRDHRERQGHRDQSARENLLTGHARGRLVGANAQESNPRGGSMISSRFRERGGRGNGNGRTRTPALEGQGGRNTSSSRGNHGRRNDHISTGVPEDKVLRMNEHTA